LLAAYKLRSMIPCIEPQPAQWQHGTPNVFQSCRNHTLAARAVSSCILVHPRAVVSPGAALEGLLGLVCMRPSSQVREMVILPTLFSRAVGCCSTAGPCDTTSVMNALAATVTSPVMSLSKPGVCCRKTSEWSSTL